MVRPVPVPNTAVKRCVADGSGFIDSARVGSRQIFPEKPDFESGFFVPGSLPANVSVECRSRGANDGNPAFGTMPSLIVRRACLEQSAHSGSSVEFSVLRQPESRVSASSAASEFGHC